MFTIPSLPLTSSITINTVNAVCGAGKTHSAIGYIQNKLQTDCILYTVPSIKLCNQIKSACNNIGIKNVITIHSKNTRSSLKLAINKAAEKLNLCGGGVLIINQAAFMHLPDFVMDKFNDWIHIMDEIINPVNVFSFELPYENNIISSRILTEETDLFPGFYRVKAKSTDLVDKFLRRSYDKFSESVKPLFRSIINKKFQTYVVKESYDNIVTKGIIFPDPAHLKFCKEGDAGFHGGNENNKLIFISVLMPTINKGFKETIMMGAYADKTRLYTFWKDKFNVTFVPKQAIIDNLRISDHTNGHLINIYYGQERAFSRTQSPKLNEITGKTGIDIHVEQAKQIFDPTEDVLCLCNKDNIANCPDNWIQLTNNSHGLNAYDTVTQFAFFGNFAYSPAERRALIMLGFTEEAIDHDLMDSPLYQAAMRSSARDINNNKTINFYVASKQSAIALSEMIPNCTLIAIDGIKEKVVGKIGKTPAERKLEYEVRKNVSNYRSKHAELLEKLLVAQNVESVTMELTGELAQLYNEIISDDDLNVAYNLYAHKRKKGKTGIQNILEIFNDLETISSTVKNDKEDSNLINFVNFADDTRQTIAAQLSFAIVLDIDGGDLTIDKFNNIMHDEQQLSYFVHSTYNHVIKDGKHRYRAIIVVDTPMTPAMHDSVFNSLKELFEEHDFYSAPHKADTEQFITNLRKTNPNAKLSGLDLSKRNVSSIFYLPAIAPNNELNAFTYRSFLASETEVKQHRLNVFNTLNKHFQRLIELSKTQSVEFELVYDRDESNKRVLSATEQSNQDFLNGKTSRKKTLIDRIHKEVIPGNRSLLACQIAGSIKHWSNSQDKLDIMNLLASKGCDPMAMKSAYKYAGLNN